MSVICCRTDARGLGDNIAWIPAYDEYQKQTGKTVIVSTFYNELFAPVYSNLIFAEPNNFLHNIEKVYIGVSVSDSVHGHKDWRTIPLQQVPFDILGMEYKPIQPKVYVPDIEIPYNNYICISEHTTRKNKYWNNPNGWQEVVDYCNLKGIKVVVCSKESTTLKGVIDCTGDRPLINRAALIKRSKAFIGASTGLAWLAWSVSTPVIMISGSTEKWHEFECYRVINENVCHGCINNELSTSYNDKFDCPRKKDYECSTMITSEMIIEELDKII